MEQPPGFSRGLLLFSVDYNRLWGQVVGEHDGFIRVRLFDELDDYRRLAKTKACW